jgi:two-component system, NtrC family, sensor kinase
MRVGIRLQIVLALSVLLVLAFVPLFVAVASLTRATLRSVREASARSLGRAVAAQVAEAQSTRDPADLESLAEAQIGHGGVAALGIYDRSGAPILRLGDMEDASALPEVAPPGSEQAVSMTTPRGPAVRVIIPGTKGIIGAVLRTDDDSVKIAPLLRLVALYTGLIALSLLVFAYIALTRLIVKPLDAISAAARRVALGARALEVPRAGPAELVGLGASLSEMTGKLRADEQRMRDQIEELERRAEALRQAQDRLVRSERLASVGRLAAGLAHEIGNPIAALLGLEDILLQGGLDPGEQHDFLVRIRKETERIHRVLRDLLDFARPASVPLGHADKPGDVTEAIDDVLALIKPQRSFRDVHIAVDIPPMLPTVTLGRERIMQVLLNLLLNAADATEQKGRISLRAERIDGRVRLIVEDDGTGIDPAVAPRLFEPFVTTKEVGEGTGLGLAVCRGLVESVDGSINLDENFRAGARFVVELPVAAVGTS